MGIHMYIYIYIYLYIVFVQRNHFNPMSLLACIIINLSNWCQPIFSSILPKFEYIYIPIYNLKYRRNCIKSNKPSRTQQYRELNLLKKLNFWNYFNSFSECNLNIPLTSMRSTQKALCMQNTYSVLQVQATELWALENRVLQHDVAR